MLLRINSKYAVGELKGHGSGLNPVFKKCYGRPVRRPLSLSEVTTNPLVTHEKCASFAPPPPIRDELGEAVTEVGVDRVPGDVDVLGLAREGTARSQALYTPHVGVQSAVGCRLSERPGWVGEGIRRTPSHLLNQGVPHGVPQDKAAPPLTSMEHLTSFIVGQTTATGRLCSSDSLACLSSL